MGWRMKVSLAKCGRCGKPYSNPVTHVCVTRIGQRQRRTQIRPRVARDCPKCGNPAGNPLTHVCRTRTDFRSRLRAEKKRQAAEKRARARKGAAAKRAQSRPQQPKHDYRACQDEACERRSCAVFREGFESGVANCPRSHEGS
jgi:hypothetical protein